MLSNFFSATKILSNVKNIAIVLLAFYLSGAQFDAIKFILGVAGLSFIFSAIYAYNNISDVVLDQKNNYKKHYAGAVQFLGEKKVVFIIFTFVLAGLVAGILINIYFTVTLGILLTVGFLYSWPSTRFKEKVILDVVFGATLTYFFRFVGAWIIFSPSFPPLLPLIGLVSAKTAGYILYKQVDRPFLQSFGIKNTITVFSNKSLIAVSVVLWSIALSSFLLMCLNSVYFKIKILGSVPLKFLFLLPVATPPLMIVYFYSFHKTKMDMKQLRAIGFVYWLAVLAIILLFL